LLGTKGYVVVVVVASDEASRKYKDNFKRTKRDGI
jgi:hypothetical protein